METLMRYCLVEVSRRVAQYLVQMALAQDEDMISDTRAKYPQGNVPRFHWPAVPWLVCVASVHPDSSRLGDPGVIDKLKA